MYIIDEAANCAESSGDYKVVDIFLGPFTSKSTKHCLQLSVCGDRKDEYDKSLALSLTLNTDDASVVLTTCSVFISICDDDGMWIVFCNC